MRFTKIPLIATLMAVALSLLIVLPALAENRERTDGRAGSANDLEVGIFADVADAQIVKMVEASGNQAVTGVYVPITPAPTTNTLGTNTGSHTRAGDEAFLRNDTVAPQSTYFNNTLYVSNNVSAYNTVLINYRHPATVTTSPTTCVQDTNNAVTAAATVTATVKNNRTARTITLELATASNSAPFSSQAFFKVVHPNTPDYVNDNGTADDATDDFKTAYREFNGPTFCADTTTTVKFDTTPSDLTDALQDVAKETQAATAGYFPVAYERASATGLYPSAQEIATIFANHGDRLTITVAGESEDLVVDGEGPEFSAITPEDNAVTRSSRLTFSFEVRDEDSGLRHDGEALITPDGDYTEVNTDGDQVLDGEPLSKAATSSVTTNGASADIQVNVLANPETDTATDYAYIDISASGEWRKAVTRAGVAYEFTAGGRSYDDDDYLYQLIGKDRAGNSTMTDAVADEDDNTADEPFVFEVDDESPALIKARTGIAYDTAKDVEKADRNFIALEFGNDALASVSTSSITVVGHTIKSVVHPNKAPAINRGALPATTPMAGDGVNPGNAPAVVKAPDDPQTRAEVHTPTDNTQTARSGNITFANTCAGTKPTAQTPGTTEITTDSTQLTVLPITAEETAYCKAWDDYRLYLIAKNTYDPKKVAYDNFLQYEKEHPGKDIEGEYIDEPRARIYLELTEDLAPDARPSVIAVGGAVTDLAGNTNEAETLSKASGVEDWIAPTLTVMVTGTAGDRPVSDKAEGSFTVDVKADEELNRRPVVYFVSLASTGNADDGYKYTIAHVDTATSLTQQEDEDHWARKYRVSSLDAEIQENGVHGVVVLAEDSAENSGATAGWTPKMHRNAAAPAETDKLDPSKMDDAHLLIEVDDDFNNGNKAANGTTDISGMIGTVTPRSDADGKETESANPFVKLVFNMEASEYSVGGFKDSHDTVKVSSITLNGENAMANLNRVSATEHSLITRDLAVGKHTVEYTAVDDAGNDYDGKFEFEVKERQPYEIDVRPGWNLVSLPATPLEPAIGSVLAGNNYITPVLGYQQGDWLTAVREEDGTWRGRLTEIEGGYGYWVHTRTFESISTMLSEADPAATLPTVPVTAGWNLLGVLDIFQNDAGDPPGVAGANGDEADNYFSSIPWKVAYTYATDRSLWIKSTPKATATTTDANGATVNVKEILNGNGYWVWSPTPSTLAP